MKTKANFWPSSGAPLDGYYGDTIGVSGSAVDPDLAVRLDWTELNRK